MQAPVSATSGQGTSPPDVSDFDLDLRPPDLRSNNESDLDDIGKHSGSSRGRRSRTPGRTTLVQAEYGAHAYAAPASTAGRNPGARDNGHSDDHAGVRGAVQSLGADA